MGSKVTRWCEGFIEAGWLAALVIAPLFFNIHSERVFEPDKLTLVRSIALMMSVAWVVRFIDLQGWRNLGWLHPRREGSIWRMPFVLPVAILVIVYLVSTAFSVTPRVSWAGSYQRLQGTYSTLSYIVIFALAVATIRRREQINRIVTTVIITSIPIALYGMLQHFALDPLPWGGNTQRRIAGHMGNAIFIAAYLIMAVPPTLARIVDAFTNILQEERFSYADVIRSSIYIFTLAIQLMAIYWSGSRGPLLGLIVGIFALVLILLVSLRNASADERRFNPADALRALAVVVVGAAVAYMLLSILTRVVLEGAMASFVAFVGALGVATLIIFIMLVARKGWRWLWLSWIVLTAVVGIWLALFNVPETQAAAYANTPVVGNVLETMAGWRELPTIGRFGRILEAEEGTGRVRVLIWQGALELLRPHEPLVFPDGSVDRWNALRPLIGYGPESMYVAYNRYYQPELGSIEARNASPDRSHNETFDALIITGAAGFLTWQVLYLSVFYYGFRWLGVVRTGRDRNMLIGLWILGAVVAAVVISARLGLVYLGVAIPFGSIAGLVIYLIYYALTARPGSDEEEDPFQVDRLLMMGLLAAVVAHYIEIHFGIAIASTRVHFFVYIALMFLVGYLLPGYQEGTVAVAEAPVSSRRRRGRGAPRTVAATGPAWRGPVLAATFVLALILGILGYNFVTFVAETEITTIEDVPLAFEIIHQSFLVNSGADFMDSPFIYLVLLLTWVLGTLISLSELARQGILNAASGAARALMPSRKPIVMALFALMAVVAVVLVVLRRPETAPLSSTQVLGTFLLLGWGLLCLIAVYLLGTNRPGGQRFSAIVAGAGLLFSLPLLLAGVVWFGLGLLALCGVLLYLTWDANWGHDLLPALILGGGSWLAASGYIVLHASLLRSSFIGPGDPTLSDAQRQVMVADGFAALLTFFYFFAFGLILLAAFALADANPQPRPREYGSVPAIAGLVGLFIVGFFLVSTTNLRIIQADIVYKRARPLERIAQQTRTPESWELPVAVYEHALELAPLEDFYHLFLGAAYLEQASISQDPAQRTQALEAARGVLMRARVINPLNTDHTANLARLTTRWAAFTQEDQQERAALIGTAKDYYQAALELSPQNSTIWNEYANLQLTLEGNCEQGIETYEHSLSVDASYQVTYLGLAGAYQTCASQAPAGEEAEYLQRAAQLILDGLEVNDQNEGSYLLQAGQLLRQAGEYEQALEVFEQLRQVADPTVPPWLTALETATTYEQMGDLENARVFGENALALAPADNQATVQQFLDGLGEPAGNE